MGSSHVDALLAELLSSDGEEDKDAEGKLTAGEEAGEDLEVWDTQEGLFEDSGDIELENELKRLRQERQDELLRGVTEYNDPEVDGNKHDQFEHDRGDSAQPVQHITTPTNSEPSQNVQLDETDGQKGGEVVFVSKARESPPNTLLPSEQPVSSEQPSDNQGLIPDEGYTRNLVTDQVPINSNLNSGLEDKEKFPTPSTQNSLSSIGREWSGMSASIASRAQQAAENILQSKSSRDQKHIPSPMSSSADKIQHQEVQETPLLEDASPNPLLTAAYGSTVAAPSGSLGRVKQGLGENGMHEASHEVEEHLLTNDSASEDVPEWEKELLAAEEATRLLAEGEEKGETSGVTERLQEVMASARQDWNPQGRPDAQGGMIGGSAAVRVTDQSDGPLAVALKDNAKYGSQQAISKSYHRPSSSTGFWYTAVGTSNGYVLIESAAYTGTIGTQQATVELIELREGGGAEATAVGFSYSGERDKFLLVAGYSHGTLVVWDVAQKKMIATISGNSVPISSCCFLPNAMKTPSTIISADVSGVVSYHSLTFWVVRTGVTSKRVISTATGPTLLSPLTPFTIPLRSGGERNVDPGANLIREDAVSVCGEGMVCICAPGMCEIGRFFGDGKLLMLYRIPAPAEQASREIPCVNWAPNFPGFVRTFSEGGVPGAQLAVGWFGSVTLYDIPTIGDWIRHGDGEFGQQGPRWNYRTTRPDPSEIRALTGNTQRMPVSMMGMWNPGNTVNSGSTPFPTPEFPIINLHWMAPGHLGALRKQGVLSQFLLFNLQMEVVEQVELDDWPKSWKATHAGHEYSWQYSSSAGLVSKLTMIGSRGLKAVRLMGWEECLEVLREIGKLKMCLHMGVDFFLHATQKSLRGANPGSVHLGNKDPALVAHRLSLLLMEYLDLVLGKEYSEDEDRLSVINEAARLSTDLCILLKMTKALFQDVFPRFVSSGYGANFLEVLEQTIIRNELNDGVAPEVVQALVEHCCDTGQPDKVERCVLRMDIAALDLNQVIRLCIGHNLFVALLYLFSRALMDVTTPALHLVNAILHASTKSLAETYTLKLLVYLRCCLRGQSYPPGSGNLPKEHEHTVEKILGFLLFTSAQHLLDAQKSMQENSRRGTASGEGDATDCIEVTSPFPVLNCLLTHKTETVISILREVLSKWDCIEKDVLEAWSGGNVEEMYSIRTMTQVTVDALTELLKLNTVSDKTSIVEYICDNVGSGRALVCPEVAIELLDHLSEKVKKAPKEKPVVEKLFCDIVKSTGIQQHRSTNHRPSASHLNRFQANQALNLASQADMMQAMSLLHHLSGNFDQALKAVIQDKSQPNMAFKYISKSLGGFEKGSEEMVSMRKAIMVWMEELVKLNPEAAAIMVLKNFPYDQQAIIQGLQGTRTLLFKFLKFAMAAAFSEDVYDTSSESYQGDMKGLDLRCLLTKEHCTMYMGLLCEFDRNSVISFLRNRDHLVDVDRCKEWCKQYGIREGLAHLLEREGDINGALEMYLQEVDSDNLALEDAVLSKDLSLDFLNRARISRAQSLGFLVQENFGVTEHRQSQYVKNVPTVLSNARKSLHAAIGLCQRNSKQLGLRKITLRKKAMLSAECPAMEQRVSMVELWFSLLKVYVDRVQYVSKKAPQAHLPLSHHDSMSSSMTGTPMASRSLHTITHHELRSMSSTASRIQESPKIGFLHDLYTVFMDEIISAMADYVPLQDIVKRIVVHHAHDRFGDFRSTLLGLISAYNYEKSMLKSVHHLMNSDAFRVLFHCYMWQRKSCGVRASSDVTDDNEGNTAGEEDMPGPPNVKSSPWPKPSADANGDLVLSPGGDNSSIPLKRRKPALVN